MIFSENSQPMRLRCLSCMNGQQWLGIVGLMFRRKRCMNGQRGSRLSGWVFRQWLFNKMYQLLVALNMRVIYDYKNRRRRLLRNQRF